MSETSKACPICREEHPPRGLSYDGRGVNSCGMYRSRIATITNEYQHLGPTLAAALELLAACKALHDALSNILEHCDSPERHMDGITGGEMHAWIERDHRAHALRAIRQSFKALTKAGE